jgi:phosphoglycerol transferase MdoB-like AlkP superfamily enzyme
MKFPWVPSDHDTAKVTVNDFIDKEPFHVYYMTISGHTNYNWSGNNMCKKHRAFMNNYCQQYGLDYSEEVKAYLACQYEVELMLTELVNNLRDAGILDRTVFVMGADHYPYGLSDASLAELYGIPQGSINSNFELYRNAFIIWNSAMQEPVHVDTPCSAIDILPTVSNLFGLEYDSRLMAGTDVLSDTEPVVIINFDGGAGSWNWITRYGSYRTSNKTFTPAEGFTATESEIEAYVKSVNNLVSAKRKYAFYVIENDYYSYVFGKKS